jgi:hypothetical protein
MGIGSTQKILKTGFINSCFLLCVATVNISADEAYLPASALPSDTLRMMGDPDNVHAGEAGSFPLFLDRHGPGLIFDLGGSETRKLQLQLEQPLYFSADSQARLLDNGSSIIGLDATLSVPVTSGLSLSGGVDLEMSNNQFQPVGSIQCMNGILRPDSYTASGCRFVNESYTSIGRQRIDLSARYDLGNASASINWFTQSANLDQPNVRQLNRMGGTALMDAGLLTPLAVNPLISGIPFVEPFHYLDSETSGIDLNFKVGISTDRAGDIQLGLALTRVFDASYQGIYGTGNNPLGWTTAEPFNTARMNFEWSHGSFSSGIQGFYREPVNFLGRNNLESMTTFDVHFTWHTPWKANLSVGTSNVLNAGVDERDNVDNPPADPFESIYGRIPYVRYKQDL